MKIIKVITAVLVLAILFFGLFEGSPYRTGILYGLFAFLAIIVAYPFIRRYYFHQMMTNTNVKFKVDRYVEERVSRKLCSFIGNCQNNRIFLQTSQLIVGKLIQIPS